MAARGGDGVGFWGNCGQVGCGGKSAVAAKVDVFGVVVILVGGAMLGSCRGGFGGPGD